MSRRAQLADDILAAVALELAMEGELTVRRLGEELQQRYEASAAKARISRAVANAKADHERIVAMAQRMSEESGAAVRDLLPPEPRAAIEVLEKTVLAAIRDVESAEADRYRRLEASRATENEAQLGALTQELEDLQEEIRLLTQERDDLQRRYDDAAVETAQLTSEIAKAEGRFEGLEKASERDRVRWADRIATLEGAIAQRGNGGPP